MMTNYAKLIADEYAAGNINSYMAERLAKASEFGMTPGLIEQAVEDAKCVSAKNIDSDDKYALRFFILNIADDMLDDTFGAAVEDEEKEDLCNFILVNQNDNYKLDNLTDYRILMYKWLCDKHMNKKAHPNTFGKNTHEPVYDVQKWILAAKELYNLLKTSKLGRGAGINVVTVGWDSDERQKFDRWLNYYESGNTEKYNVKTADTKNIDDLGLPEYMLAPESRSNSHDMQMIPHKETQKEKELEKARLIKRKMKSRIRSLRKLLDSYNELLSHQSVEGIQDEMYALDKSITKLDVYASMADCIVRSANRIQRMGFVKGAEILRKFAAEPAAPAPEATPPATDEHVMQSLPPPKSGEPNASDVNLEMIIKRLEGLTKELKARNLVRELSSIDILLNEIGLSSYFPELGDSQSKLIESFSYASNRVEAIVSKLRGTGKAVSKMQATKPNVAPVSNLSAGDIQQSPVGQVQNKLPTE